MSTMATHDFYSPVHKGLRLGLSGLLVRLGQVDPDDGAELAALMGDLRRQLAICAGHLDNEDREVHAALLARAPDAVAVLAAAHESHRQDFAALGGLIDAIGTHGGLAGALRALYLAFSRFVADDLAHMAHEEEVTLPLMQRLFSDAELMAIEDRIIAADPPEYLIATARLVIPALDPAERARLLRDFRAKAPADAFTAIIDLAARPSLPAAQWQRLVADLGLSV